MSPLLRKATLVVLTPLTDLETSTPVEQKPPNIQKLHVRLRQHTATFKVRLHCHSARLSHQIGQTVNYGCILIHAKHPPVSILRKVFSGTADGHRFKLGQRTPAPHVSL
jgi:hypothetical protein